MSYLRGAGCILLIWSSILAQTLPVAYNEAQALLPGIHEYVHVDAIPSPLNLSEVSRAIEAPLPTLKQKVEGRVYCRILIDHEGRYKQHVITYSDRIEFTQAVEAQLPQLHYEPARRDGKAVAYWVNQFFDFKADAVARQHARVGRNITFLGSQNRGSRQTAQRLLDDGLAALADRRYPDARAHLINCIRLFPKKPKRTADLRLLFMAHYYAAKAEMSLAHWTPASHHLTEAIGLSLHPRGYKGDLLGSAYKLRCEALLRQGENLRALESCNWALYHYADEVHLLPELYAIRSEIHLTLGKVEAAFADVAHSLEVSPNCATAHLQKARILTRLEGYEAACESLQQAQRGMQSLTVWAYHDLTHLQRQACTEYMPISRLD